MVQAEFCAITVFLFFFLFSYSARGPGVPIGRWDAGLMRDFSPATAHVHSAAPFLGLSGV